MNRYTKIQIITMVISLAGLVAAFPLNNGILGMGSGVSFIFCAIFFSKLSEKDIERKESEEREFRLKAWRFWGEILDIAIRDVETPPVPNFNDPKIKRLIQIKLDTILKVKAGRFARADFKERIFLETVEEKIRNGKISAAESIQILKGLQKNLQDEKDWYREPWEMAKHYGFEVKQDYQDYVEELDGVEKEIRSEFEKKNK